MGNIVRREAKEDKVYARIDESLRESLEDVKQMYGFGSDSDAIRGLITLAKNREQLTAEVEGRVLRDALPILESRLKEFFQSEEFKELVLQIVLDELTTVPE